ncbi:unnamed protein product, partial [marine sediment metagenome]
LGVIPRETVPKIKLARVNLKRMDEILKETHHDMTAFLGAVSDSLGNESRFIHLGLTSSDVIDTALSLQLVEATEILSQDIKELISVLAQKAIEHKYTVMIGRTHGIHAEPTSFGFLNNHRPSGQIRRVGEAAFSGKIGIKAVNIINDFY